METETLSLPMQECESEFKRASDAGTASAAALCRAKTRAPKWAAQGLRAGHAGKAA